jgi:hypothetical protein
MTKGMLGAWRRMLGEDGGFGDGPGTAPCPGSGAVGGRGEPADPQRSLAAGVKPA